MAPPPDASSSSKEEEAPLHGEFMGKPASFLLSLYAIEGLGVRVCQVTLTVLLAGYYLMMNDWQQHMWFIFACPVAFALAPWPKVWPIILRDRFLRYGAHFLAWMTLSSFLAHTVNTHHNANEAVYWLFGTVLLIAFALLCWHSASDLQALQHVGWWTGMAAALAAVVSMVVFYGILPGHVFGERLCNWFVYGGLNPVATGLTLGFASMWLTCARNSMQHRNERLLASIAIVILLVAVFFTRSRGAVLSLIVGHAVLIFVYGLRANRTPLAIFATIALIFQVSGPMVSMLSTKQAVARTPVQALAPGQAPAPILSPTTNEPLEAYSNPARELINRGDNGRFQLYGAGIAALQSPRHWFFGIGQWSTEHLWKPCIGWNPEHLHSAFLATLIHGGIIGFALLMVVFSIGSWRAFQLARAGHGTWLVLLACGTAGMLFDGQTFTTFASIPRMEAILVIFPLVIASAAYHQIPSSKNALIHDQRSSVH